MNNCVCINNGTRQYQGIKIKYHTAKTAAVQTMMLLSIIYIFVRTPACQPINPAIWTSTYVLIFSSYRFLALNCSLFRSSCMRLPYPHESCCMAGASSLFLLPIYVRLTLSLDDTTHQFHSVSLNSHCHSDKCNR